MADAVEEVAVAVVDEDMVVKRKVVSVRSPVQRCSRSKGPQRARSEEEDKDGWRACLGGLSRSVSGLKPRSRSSAPAAPRMTSPSAFGSCAPPFRFLWLLSAAPAEYDFTLPPYGQQDAIHGVSRPDSARPRGIEIETAGGSDREWRRVRGENCSHRYRPMISSLSLCRPLLSASRREHPPYLSLDSQAGLAPLSFSEIIFLAPVRSNPIPLHYANIDSANLSNCFLRPAPITLRHITSRQLRRLLRLMHITLVTHNKSPLQL